MKQIIVILISLMTFSCVSTKIKYERADKFFPIDSGNIWIYADSIWVNDLLQKTSLDTFKVEEDGIIEYLEFDNTVLVSDDDSIYQWKGMKGEHMMLDLWFVETKKPDTLDLDWDDDVVMRREVEPISGSYKLHKTNYFQCIKYKDFCNSYYILAKGVGVIESKKIHCQKRHQLIQKKTLLSYKLKKQ